MENLVIDQQLYPRIVKEIQAKKEYKLEASVKKIRGLKLWKLNLSTLQVGEIQPHYVAAIDITNRKPIKRIQVVREPGCIYFQALNAASAIKKSRKILFEIFEKYGPPGQRLQKSHV